MIALRRRTLLGGAALPLFAINTPRARAAEFSLKLANNSPVTHPQSVRQQEAPIGSRQRPMARSRSLCFQTIS